MASRESLWKNCRGTGGSKRFSYIKGNKNMYPNKTKVRVYDAPKAKRSYMAIWLFLIFSMLPNVKMEDPPIYLPNFVN